MKRTGKGKAQPDTITDTATNVHGGHKAGSPIGARTITDQQRAAVLTMMAEHPEATPTEISRATGVTRPSVYRIRQETLAMAQAEEATDVATTPAKEGSAATPDGSEVESTVAYGRRLAKRLPMSKRVELWAQLAQGKVDPRIAFAQKAALQRIEEIIGHVTAKEKGESEANKVPMAGIFILPAGAAPAASLDLPATVPPKPETNVH